MRAALPIALVLGACGGDADHIDSFPVSVDMSDAGPVIVAVSAGVDGPVLPGVVDTLSPITILDSFTPGEAEQSPRRRQIELVLHGGTVDNSTPRVAFPSVSTFDMHPCTGVDDYCKVGLEGDTHEARVILGADVLSRNAVRFDIPAQELSFFPDIAGDNAARARACEAVFTAPFAGGGTIVLSGSEVPFSGNRIALGACTHYDTEQPIERDRGTNHVFILSTGLGVSLIVESAYERYAALVDDAALAPPIAQLPAATVQLPSNRIRGALGSITRMALVGEGSEKRGPCQELYANHLMAVDACVVREIPTKDCPCDSSLFCKTAAAVELSQSFPVLIIDDLDPMVQALRDELRPAHPEVDGVLALSAIAPLSLDIDYPNNRVLARCADDTTCQTRPAIRSRNTLDEVTPCLPPPSADVD